MSMISIISIGTDYLVLATAPNSQARVGFRLSAMTAFTPESYGCAVRLGETVLCISSSTDELIDALYPAEEEAPVPTPQNLKEMAEARKARSRQLLERSAV